MGSMKRSIKTAGKQDASAGNGNGLHPVLVPRERSRQIAAVDAWMRQHCPGDGVDALLTHPITTARMAMAVLGAQGVDVADALLVLDEWAKRFADIVQKIDGVCRAAMNARKEGKLRPHAPSPATRAAATRRRSRRLTPPGSGRNQP